MADNRIVPVILSGGSGTRLWPLSSRRKPKQFLALASERTMLQETALRASDPALFAPPVVVGSTEHASLLSSQLAEVGISPAALILEPSARNTAPAIALAALAVPPDRLLLVMPSDHVVREIEAFLAAVAAARPLAEQDWLVTFGIRATRAETGFGYIRRGDALGAESYRVERFVEKPDSATAQLYLDEGCYDWNGGIFMLRAGRYLDALQALAPAVLESVSSALAGSIGAEGEVRPDPDRFARSPSVSIDYAVMEKDRRVAVVPVEMGWSDIGSWDALHELREADARGNVATGPATLIDSDNCLVHSAGKRVVTLGVSDLIVVVGDDEVLVLPRGQSQRVKEAAERAT
ncbi:MAG TPA: mannose-1-phosphate guanylyltransferase/mannose-6-phosphate isomerase [Allosphingosinicella sp.]|jgi:mannose-1-phosphate guanylyltransferase/mannose-1-phosphate guanylyltransferase/mannose-6-phosphate isomerase